MKPESCKKFYEAPEAEVVCFGEDDIVTTKTGDTHMPPISGNALGGLTGLSGLY